MATLAGNSSKATTKRATNRVPKCVIPIPNATVLLHQQGEKRNRAAQSHLANGWFSNSSTFGGDDDEDDYDDDGGYH